MTCKAGATIYKYDKDSVDLNLQTISLDDTLHNVSQLMHPSSGLTSDKEIRFQLKLTPFERKSNIYISLVAINAESVVISPDNPNINTSEVYDIVDIF